MEQPFTIPEGIKGLVFDMDGTLINSMPTALAAYLHVADKYPDLKFEAADMHRLAGRSIVNVWTTVIAEQNLSSSYDPKNLTDQWHEYFNAEKKNFKAIDCVTRIVAEGKTRGLKLAVASGTWHKGIEENLAIIGFTDTFDALVGGDDVAKGKPDPETFAKAAQLLGLNPAECVGFEDAELGMQSIKAAGYALAVDVTQFPGYPQWV